MDDLSLDEDLVSPNSQDNSFLSDDPHLPPEDFSSSLVSTSMHPPGEKGRLRVERRGGVSVTGGQDWQVKNLLAQMEIKEEKIASLERVMSEPSLRLAYVSDCQLKLSRYEVQIDEMTRQISALEDTVASLRKSLAAQQSDLHLENRILKDQIERLRSEHETRIIGTDEVKKLRVALEEKTKKLVSLQRLVPTDSLKPANLFSFLTSDQAQVWTGLCTSVSHILSACDSRDSVAVALHLDSIVALLEAKEIANSPTVDSLAEVTLNVSKALNQGRVPWERVSDLALKAQVLCQEEVQRLGRPEAPGPKPEAAEEYLSDFSDEDFSVEVEEEDLACQAVPKLQSALPKFQFSHSGPISPQGLFHLLSLRVLDASEPSLEAFIRRVPFPNGLLMFETFVKDVKTRSPQWWMKTLSAASFDLQHQVREGTFVQLPVWGDWVRERIQAKLQRYMALERIAATEMVDRVFEGGRLSKRELRRVLRDFNFPLNREDCHSLFRLLDPGDGYVTAAHFSQFLATAAVPAPVVQPVEELAALSERDARFRLIQAEQRIADLEHNRSSLSPNLTKEHTLSLQLSTLRKDYDLLTAQLEAERRQLQSLHSENEQLRMRASAPLQDAAEQRRSEAVLEDIETQYRGQLQQLTEEKEAAVAEQRRRHEEEKAGLLRLVKNKNRELESLNGEVDRLLRDLAEIRGA